MRTLLALALLALVAAGVYALWPTPGTAHLRVFTYPAADMTIDGGRILETPTCGTVVLPSGRHTLVFRSRTGGLGKTLTIRLESNRYHVLVVDIETGHFDMES